jgi:acyl dehydratase/NAD(P)-dependent dehydrogenase (short-subunit alcohol dehydrogenase family)
MKNCPPQKAGCQRSIFDSPPESPGIDSQTLRRSELLAKGVLLKQTGGGRSVRMRAFRETQLRMKRSMVHAFSDEAQRLFARLSGDHNPIHIDPVAARRLLYGRPVVHGVHVLLVAIDRWLHDARKRIRLTRLSAKFLSPVFLDEQIEFCVTPEGAGCATFVARQNGVKALAAKAAWEDPTDQPVAVFDEEPVVESCHELSGPTAVGVGGQLPLCLASSIASRLFPDGLRNLPPEQIAILLGTSRLVGMEAPGLHSLFAGLDLKKSAIQKPAALTYLVDSYDERVPMMNLQVAGAGLAGSLTAVVRPAPIVQASAKALRQLVVDSEFRGERALVIGGSRGLGEVAAKLLAMGGAEVRFTYHRGELDAQRVAAEIVSEGGSAQFFAYDVLNDAESLPDRLADWRPGLVCYFATPHIGAGAKGEFSFRKFNEMCQYYVQGFHDIVQALRRQGDALRAVLCASSEFVDHAAPAMAEYSAAKAAAESLCRSLSRSAPGIAFLTPRFPRLATDQTAGILTGDFPAPEGAVLAALREMRTAAVSGNLDADDARC